MLMLDDLVGIGRLYKVMIKRHEFCMVESLINDIGMRSLTRLPSIENGDSERLCEILDRNRLRQVKFLEVGRRQQLND